MATARGTTTAQRALPERLEQRVDAVRRFNRFYTKQIGVLEEHLLMSPFSLTEARVLYELAQVEQTTATDLGAALGLDAGYLSRVLSAFEKRSLLVKKPSKTDGRRSLLRLTKAGRKAFRKINLASHNEVGAMLGDLSEDKQTCLVAAMETIEDLLGTHAEQRAPYLLRPPHPGDMGWVVQRHGALYAREYGWDEHFEALVAEIVAKFIRAYDAKRESCWIAEKNGENVGSVFLVKQAETVAQLRLLLVEPSARGLGIGTRLVEECRRFAQQAGYKKITLWTNSVLHAARKIYENEGYRLVKEEPHHSFGHDLIGQTWELEL